jgi:hypothetical protein
MFLSIVRPALAVAFIAGIGAFADPAAAGQPYNRYPIVGITSANAWLSGSTQPYNRYPNTGITSANAWLSGSTQPYNRYPNTGITSANAWLSGSTQPYNKYHCVPNVGKTGADGVCR